MPKKINNLVSSGAGAPGLALTLTGLLDDLTAKAVSEIALLVKPHE